MKTLTNNKKGQAVFEFLVFLPFLIIMYSIIYTVGNSINASINQQKATRGYYFGVVKGNSYIFSTAEVNEYRNSGIKVIGLSSVAWRQRSEGGGDRSFASCYTFNGLVKSGINDECIKRDHSVDISRHVRVYTAFGTCGPSFVDDGNSVIIDPTMMSNIDSCSLRK